MKKDHAERPEKGSAGEISEKVSFEIVKGKGNSIYT